MLKGKEQKAVQGAWLTVDDRRILEREAAAMGLRSATQLASIILREFCNKKRLEAAEKTIEESKRRGRDEREKQGCRN